MARDQTLCYVTSYSQGPLVPDYVCNVEISSGIHTQPCSRMAGYMDFSRSVVPAPGAHGSAGIFFGGQRY